MEKSDRGLILLERITCPLCKGRPYLSAFAQENDPPCPVCNGKGEIYTEMCQCGRASTRLRDDGTPYCGRADCIKLEVVDAWRSYSSGWGFGYHGFNEWS